ncbi:hypothetical protein I7I51_05462 [Histoplasma capsulatum]|uniref:Uncharacterized protein n=1 Tax=Ajellomyces capsulatus TaxID=5037 RepID=A0A8A1M3V5_AJECA|nr:hypothetical protein I7I51_05462 [Histoplasma capsulatum]
MNMLDQFQLKGNRRLLHPHTGTDPADEDKSAARNPINTPVFSRTAILISTLQPCMPLSPYSLIRDDKHRRRPPHKSQQWDKCSQEILVWDPGARGPQYTAWGLTDNWPAMVIASCMRNNTHMFLLRYLGCTPQPAPNAAKEQVFHRFLCARRAGLHLAWRSAAGSLARQARRFSQVRVTAKRYKDK